MMKDSHGTYDGRKPEPPYECPSCPSLSARIKELEREESRYRGMILYAANAPYFDSCKSILRDALDGVSGADNYDEVKGEREILRARITPLEKVAEEAQKILWVFVCHCDSAYTGRGRHEPNAICGEEVDLQTALRTLDGKEPG